MKIYIISAVLFIFSAGRSWLTRGFSKGRQRVMPLFAAAFGNETEDAEQWISKLESNRLSLKETEETAAAPVSMNLGSKMWEENSTSIEIAVHEFSSQEAAIQAEKQFQEEMTEDGDGEMLPSERPFHNLCLYMHIMEIHTIFRHLWTRYHSHPKSM
ncbi:hypothetical protein CHL76_15430 [Marinococcus halophilus]|nr:hypothetical protein CHL76_15430 [Marinococcus halophilus]